MHVELVNSNIYSQWFQVNLIYANLIGTHILLVLITELLCIIYYSKNNFLIYKNPACVKN